MCELTWFITGLTGWVYIELVGWLQLKQLISRWPGRWSCSLFLIKARSCQKKNREFETLGSIFKKKNWIAKKLPKYWRIVSKPSENWWFFCLGSQWTEVIQWFTGRLEDPQGILKGIITRGSGVNRQKSSFGLWEKDRGVPAPKKSMPAGDQWGKPACNCPRSPKVLRIGPEKKA